MKNTLMMAAAATLATLAACSDRQQKSTKGTDPLTEMRQTSIDDNTATSNTMLPGFLLQDINGQPVNLQSFRGKKVFVNLWASWCPPCRREMPSIQKLYQSVDTSRVAFVMLSLDDQFEKAKAFVKNQKLKLPIYYPSQHLPELFNVQGIPVTFIFDEQGTLIQRIDGAADYHNNEYRKLLQ